MKFIMFFCSPRGEITMRLVYGFFWFSACVGLFLDSKKWFKINGTKEICSANFFFRLVPVRFVLSFGSNENIMT